jgi:hypothetical protein
MAYIYLMYAEWIAAGVLLVAYLAHRRKRKSSGLQLTSNH